jgi:hypothetical protein
VQQVVPPVRGVHRHRHAQPVDQKQDRTIEKEARAQYPDVDPQQSNRVDELEFDAQEVLAHRGATD